MMGGGEHVPAGSDGSMNQDVSLPPARPTLGDQRKPTEEGQIPVPSNLVPSIPVPSFPAPSIPAPSASTPATIPRSWQKRMDRPELSRSPPRQRNELGTSSQATAPPRSSTQPILPISQPPAPATSTSPIKSQPPAARTTAESSTDATAAAPAKASSPAKPKSPTQITDTRDSKAPAEVVSDVRK